MARRMVVALCCCASLLLAQAGAAQDDAPPSLDVPEGRAPDVAAPVESNPTPADSTAIPRARLRVRDVQVVVLRAGPGTAHPIVATVFEDDVLVVDARTGPWYHATTPDGASGWVHESLLANDIDRVKFAFAPDPGKIERQGTMQLVAFAGGYAADREDNSFLYGARLGYALSPRVTFEVAVGRTRVRRSTFIIEQLFNLRIEEELFDVFYYEAGASYDILARRRVTPFVALGFGATILNARVEPTWSMAIGTRAFLTRRMALRWEIRDHRLEAGNQFTRFTGDNLEFSAGAEVLF